MILECIVAEIHPLNAHWSWIKPKMIFKVHVYFFIFRHLIVIRFCNKTYEAMGNFNDNHEIKRNRCNKVVVNIYSHFFIITNSYTIVIRTKKTNLFIALEKWRIFMFCNTTISSTHWFNWMDSVVVVHTISFQIKVFVRSCKFFICLIIPYVFYHDQLWYFMIIELGCFVTIERNSIIPSN